MLASPPSIVITCSGFCRKWNAPCGPDEPKSTPNGKTLPCLTRPAACCDLLGGDQVQRAEFVGVTPPPPVADVVGDTPKVIQAGHVPPFACVRDLAEEALRHGTAVHPEDLAGDVSRRGTVEEHQRARLLVRTRDTAEGGLKRVDELMTERGAQLVEDGRVGDARCGAVDPDALRAERDDVGHPVEDGRLLRQPIAAAVGDRLGIPLTPLDAFCHRRGVQQPHGDPALARYSAAASEETLAIADPGGIDGISASVKCRMPRKLIVTTSNGFPMPDDTPAMLKSASTGPPIAAAALSIDAGSDRSIS